MSRIQISCPRQRKRSSKRDFKSWAPIPTYDSDNSDPSTVIDEDTDDETTTVVPKKKKKDLFSKPFLLAYL